MPKKVWLLLVISLVIVSCTPKEDNKVDDKPFTQENYQKPSTIASQDYGLGTLCSNEEECYDFCRNNRGRCENYCNEHTTNGICQNLFPQNNLPPCGSNYELFTASPIAITEISNIVPLGNLNPSGHTFPTSHLYFFTKNRQISSVMAPSDIWITGIESSEMLSENPYTDYSIRFSPCREFYAYFHHVSNISEELKNAFVAPFNECQEYVTGGELYRRCKKNVNIPLKAGQALGKAGGAKGGLDLGTSDTRVAELQYANPSRWGEGKGNPLQLYVVCPIDYYPSGLRNELMELLGNEKRRTVEPICGQVEQDELGTSQGIWFVKGTKQTYPEDSHLSLVHDNFDPLKPVFSIGTSLSSNGLGSGTYFFDLKDSGLVNRDFKYIFPDGNIYCYDSLAQRFGNQVSGRIILQLTSPATLRIQTQKENTCGTGPWSFDKFTEFER